jgi:hypothetical protein
MGSLGYAAQRRNVEFMAMTGVIGLCRVVNGRVFDLMADGQEAFSHLVDADTGEAPPREWVTTIERLRQDFAALEGFAVSGTPLDLWKHLLKAAGPKERSKLVLLPRHIPDLVHWTAAAACEFVYDFQTAKALSDLAPAVWAYSMLRDDAEGATTRNLAQQFRDHYGTDRGDDAGEQARRFVVSFAKAGERFETATQ